MKEAHSKQNSAWADMALIVFIGMIVIGCLYYIRQVFSSFHSEVSIDLSLFALPKYTFFSLSRGMIAFLISLLFSLCSGFWAAKDRVAEKVLVPLLDVLQSIPILGFMPGLILLLISLFPHNNIGLELAAILMIVTSQVWNMAFGVYNSICMIPKEKIDCATTYHFNSWQRLKWVELPSTVINLVWNSILSVAGGWFFLMLSESFQLGNKDFRLPGLGSYMAQAATEGNIQAILLAISFMILLILLLDQFLWRPLIVWSQKFRIETISSVHTTDSWFVDLLSKSFLLSFLSRVLQSMKNSYQDFQAKRERKKNLPAKNFIALYISRIGLTLLFILLTFGLFSLTPLLLKNSFPYWKDLMEQLGYTFSRVLICLTINTLWALPLGLLIGLSPKLSKALAPTLQVAASFPTTLLFPILIWMFTLFNIPLTWGSLFLMLLGSGWYILFNVIAGVNSIPSDLKEVAKNFRFNLWLRMKRLYLPALFPSLVTGLCTAAGGAWNTSIVAEYVSYKGSSWSIPGIGASISLAAESGDMAALASSIVLMVVVVGLFNCLVWLKLYHYAEKRFALNN